MHAPSTVHTHMRVASLPPSVYPPLSPSPFWGRRRVPAAPWNAPRSMPECQARRTTSERANTVQRRANYAKYAAEADAAAAATLAGILTCLPSPLTHSLSFPLLLPPCLSPSFPASLPHSHSHARTAARLGHAHIWEEGKEERREEKKGMRARRRQEAEKRMSSANAPPHQATERERELVVAATAAATALFGWDTHENAMVVPQRAQCAVYRRHRRRRRRPHVPGHPPNQARQRLHSILPLPVPPRMKRRRRRWSDGPTERASGRGLDGWIVGWNLALGPPRPPSRRHGHTCRQIKCFCFILATFASFHYIFE